MRVALVALMVALLAVPAFARVKKQSPAQQQQNEVQRKKAEALDNNYKASLGRIPDQKPADPWGTMR
jgi:hypothetical protein